jgi:CubicO group peptidase (beta-lactamase class C family)
VLGLTIEKISGQTLGQYLEVNLFAPLGMTDTGFSIAADKAARYAKPLPADPDTGKPQARSPELTQPLKFECGGGCAASTASDYLRFALMLMNGGRAGEARLLGPRTVAYMLSDQLGSNIKNLVGNADPTRADYSFGLGVAVRTTPGAVRMMGSVGQFSWPGASGTDWWVDPKEELAVVYLSAAPGPIRWHYRQKINAMVYQAITE